MYSDVELFIGGEWRPGASNRSLVVLNPATSERIGYVAHADTADLDEALEAADKGFAKWRSVSAFDRYKVLRKAADLLRERVHQIAPLLTLEQGKPLSQASMELLSSADIIDWFAEEAKRAYGRIIPSRAESVSQWVMKEPVGPVVAFSPWNFPVGQAARKISAALAAGCSIIIKAPEETPASPAGLVRCFADAGVPAGVVNLVFGVPSEISEYLIPNPVIRKVSFTGSTVVGKHLASIAGQHMKPTTMELGGHSPAIVFDDFDVDRAVNLLSAAKYRNAGQVCVSPTRFLIQETIFEAFVDQFVARASSLVVGDGLSSSTEMGPLANPRRVGAMESMIGEATQRGAKNEAGGNRIGNRGNFFEPTVLTNVPADARIMNEEPFGPVALIAPFSTLEDAVKEANRLPYGLASYAYTRSLVNIRELASRIETGNLAINHQTVALPEVPFGGVKESGHGSEGGLEGLEAYLVTKYVTHSSA